jgi:hypothetical protein
MDILEFSFVFWFIYLIVAIILASTFGEKKRIGTECSFLLLVSGGILLGVLAILLSPPKNNLPPPNPKDKLTNIFFGSLFLILCIWTIISLVSSKDYGADEGGIFIKASVMLLLDVPTAYYFFTRLERHARLYRQQEAQKNTKTETGN